nr:reverse transcriptase domain-containing protein [Tanacetum cinerariifolium]
MAEQDEEKTAFHTSHGVYYYTKRPFGLKNAGATYQQLVDKVFDRKIGQNLEIYVDDLCGFDDRKGHNLDTGLFCEPSAADSRAKLYPNGKASPDAGLRNQKPNDALPEASVIETLQELWTLFRDGSSCVDGSKYEALIAGLRISAQMGVHNLHVSVDSKLVANQVLGTYVIKEENMIKYLEKTKSLINGFANFSISQVPRSKNKKADALIKIASTNFAHLSKQVLVEILKEKSIQEKEMATVVEEEGPTWMTPIIEYLRDETLIENQKEASKLRIKARQYELLKRILYRRSFLKP